MQDYSIEYISDWNINFIKFDKSVQEKILKKIAQLKLEISARHLYYINCYVVEAGQYRIVFKTDERVLIRKIVFVGNHKQYEKWLGIK
ncbi:MAG: hypothetical protein COT15_03245 [Candidatus Diapherotrites archaeon CG08_land_8_20_14_0_20_34_12]|nr:MAG: hypothetical protein COT15_03245 [Candidatus Diapherotrites archaeon CG08_land_8_20_14_0_20_34_12]